MSTILITGGSGLVGTALCKWLLQKEYAVIIMGRSIPAKKIAGVQYALWDVKKQTIDADALLMADHIVHLAGASVFEKRWTKKRKQEILESRTKSSDLLLKALSANVHKVKTIVSASAIGWYGPDAVEGKAFTEDDPADPGFLGQVCKQWEQHIEPAEAMGIRLVKLRFGLVLSNLGGFMEPIKAAMQWGIAALPGGGKQVLSWIHIRDLNRLIVFAIENNEMKGSINAVAPQPVPLSWLVLAYAQAIKKSFYIPMSVPGFFLRWILGEKSIEITKSATVSCSLAKSFGFSFIYPSGEAVVNALVTNPHE